MIISLQWKFDHSWCCILLSPSMFGFFVTTISSAKCDVFVLIFQTKIVPKNVLHVPCCFLHTLVYITFTSLFSIVCAKTEQFNEFQRYLLNWWFWCDKYLIRSHLRASTCALRLSAWQSTWTMPPSPVLSEAPRGLGCTVPVLEVLVEGDSWGAGRWGNFTVISLSKVMWS